jgi:glutamine synthetase
VDNRTVALRIIQGSDSATRVEKRDAGADCNPYLLLATDLAAGLDGIEQKIAPGPETTGNAYESADEAGIPTDLATAIALARGSDWMQDVLGEHLYEIVCQQSERELEFFNQQVTQVELDRYRSNF